MREADGSVHDFHVFDESSLHIQHGVICFGYWRNDSQNQIYDMLYMSPACNGLPEDHGQTGSAPWGNEVPRTIRVGRLNFASTLHRELNSLTLESFFSILFMILP